MNKLKRLKCSFAVFFLLLTCINQTMKCHLHYGLHFCMFEISLVVKILNVVLWVMTSCIQVGGYHHF